MKTLKCRKCGKKIDTTMIRGFNLPYSDYSSWGMDEEPTYIEFKYKVIGNIYENPELLKGDLK